jgi:hypothetical protein
LFPGFGATTLVAPLLLTGGEEKAGDPGAAVLGVTGKAGGPRNIAFTSTVLHLKWKQKIKQIICDVRSLTSSIYNHTLKNHRLNAKNRGIKKFSLARDFLMVALVI